MLKAISLTNKALALIKAAWLWLTHYKVCVLWGGLPAPDWRATHYAKTFGEALEVAEGYPHEDITIVIGKRTKLLAARGSW